MQTAVDIHPRQRKIKKVSRETPPPSNNNKTSKIHTQDRLKDASKLLLFATVGECHQRRSAAV